MTNLDKLRALAAELLQTHGTVPRASRRLATALVERRPLLLALCLDFLERLQPQPQPQPQSETPVARGRQGPRRQLGVPSRAARSAAMAASVITADSIFQRRIRGAGPLGELYWYQLAALADSSAHTAGSFLKRGYQDAVDSVAMRKLLAHSPAADSWAKVSDVVNAATAFQLYQEAEIEAAEVIRDGSAQVAARLLASRNDQGLPSS